MRWKTAYLGPTALLVAAGLALGQSPANQLDANRLVDQAKKAEAIEQVQKGKSDGKKTSELSLEELLAQALKSNADIRVGESKVHEAEAELYRTRMQVLGKIVLLRHEIAAAKALAVEATERYQRNEELFKRKVLSQSEYAASQSTMLRHKATLESKEAELELLVGKQSAQVHFHSPDGVWIGRSISGSRPWSDPESEPALWNKALVVKPADPVRAVVADQVCRALETPVKVAFENVAIGDAIKYLQDHAKGVNIHLASRQLAPEAQVTLKLAQQIPLRALMQWFEDEYELRFVLRDYGIVLTDRDRIPPGAVLLLDFCTKRAFATSGK